MTKQKFAGRGARYPAPLPGGVRTQVELKRVSAALPTGKVGHVVSPIDDGQRRGDIAQCLKHSVGIDILEVIDQPLDQPHVPHIRGKAVDVCVEFSQSSQRARVFDGPHSFLFILKPIGLAVRIASSRLRV